LEAGGLLALGLLVLAAYFAGGTLIALAARRRLLRGGESDFYVAGGRLGAFLSAMTYAATTYSSFMIVGLVGFAYFTGIGSLVFELAYLAATVALLGAFAGRVWRMARERGWVSPGEALADLYGAPWLAALASLIFLVSLVPYASAQLKGIGEAVAGMAGGGGHWYLAGVALGAAAMVAWSLAAGIWSVAATDAFQGLWMLASATLLALWLAYTLASGGVGLGYALSILASEGLLGPAGFWTLPVFLAFTVPWVFFAVTNPQVVQRLFMPRDEASLRRMIGYFAVFGLYYTLLVVAIGFMARVASEAGVLPLSPGGRDEVTPQLLYLAPPLLAAAVFTSIVAASVSTADSIVLTLASSVSRDIGLRLAGLGERARMLLGYGAAVAFIALMAAVASARIGYIVQLSVLSSLLLLGLAPPTLAAWAGLRGRPALVAAAMLAGPAIVGALTAATGSPLEAFRYTFSGVPVSVAVLAVSAALTAAAVALERGRRHP
jgi:SSS family solute:Na+ symporter